MGCFLICFLFFVFGWVYLSSVFQNWHTFMVWYCICVLGTDTTYITTRQKNLCALPSPTTFMGLIKHHSNQNFIRQSIEWKTKSYTNSSFTSSHHLSCESINVLYIGRLCIYFEMHLFKFTILYLHIFRYCRKYFRTKFWNIFFSGWKLLWCIMWNTGYELCICESLIPKERYVLIRIEIKKNSLQL